MGLLKITLSFLIGLLTSMIIITNARDMQIIEDKSTTLSEYMAPEQLFDEINTDRDSSLSFATTSENSKLVSKLSVSTKLWDGFSSSMTMIIATEIGDKTFFIAAVLSMRNSRIAVFTGAILALVCMTILSTLLGIVLPTFLPRQYAHFIGGLLFLYFGIKLIYDSRSMENKVSNDLEEVEEELLHTRKKDESNSAHSTNDDVESGDSAIYTFPFMNDSGNVVQNNTSNGKKKEPSISSVPNVSGDRVFLQSFILTFLAEWGDRSQIATIALAAAKDPFGVTFGACLGHLICTGMAVIGGRIMASRINEKSVSLWGGIIFLAFGLRFLVFEM